jgi:hypothetical protein
VTENEQNTVTEETAPVGRPTLYSDEMALSICTLIAEGFALTQICRNPENPSLTTVYRWLTEKPEFRDMYARAKEDQADTLAEEILEIADYGINDTYEDENGHKRTNHDVIQRSRLRVEARKWIAAKLKPKKYGDKIQQEVSGVDGAPLQVKVYVPDNGRGSN